jgi:cytoskeletal protein RodZ
MTYCTGFARAYARAVGMDESALVAQLRRDVDEMGGLGQNPYEFEEAVNPARVPPRSLAWVAALLVILLAAGYGLWRMQINAPPTDDQIDAQRTQEEAQSATANAAAPTVAAAPVPTGPVVMTAADDVWMRIYEADGKRLFEGTLAKGQSFTVPADAREPLILTGRPDALAVTVGGQAIPPLGTAERTISDVPISATALLARPQQPISDEGVPARGSNAASVSSVAPAAGSNSTTP